MENLPSEVRETAVIPTKDWVFTLIIVYQSAGSYAHTAIHTGQRSSANVTG